MSAGTADKLIARLPADERRKILDAIANARGVQRGDPVIVEHSYRRRLDETQQLVGRVLGVAWAPGGSGDLVLIVRPIDPTLRMVAIPAAHVCRVSWARHHGTSSLADETNPKLYRRGEILAGPPERIPA